MAAPNVMVKIGGMNLAVPAYQSQEETGALVQTINDRLQQLEKSSKKVNTQAFALQIAYEYARQMAELREEVRSTENALVRALSQVAKRVDALRSEMEESA